MNRREQEGDDIGPGGHGRLVVVSNRLPITLARDESSEWGIEAGSGGLVTAMAPVLRRWGGLWIGWPGIAAEEDVDLDALLPRVTDQLDYDLRPVALTARERDSFYLGFSNEVIWPLFHDLQTLYNFDPSYWITYQQVNRKYAEVIVENVEDGDYVWVHDYHLMNVALEMRALGFQGRVGFFLHTPFPNPDIYLKLPWRFEILQGLLQYDLVGFQTIRDRRNFLHCVQRLLVDVPMAGTGAVVTCRVADRRMRVGSFPIAIDFEAFNSLGSDPDVAERCERLRERLPGRRLVLGVDRLDYTKGIPYRLQAFREALKKFPDLRGSTTLIQVVVPSREDIPEYAELKEEIEGMVGRINGEFTQAGWVPIHYLYRSLDRPDLVALYKCAEVALVTPLKDGMNLVAKEYCAAHEEESGVLILSEFAGAADQLQDGALLVNPYDIEGMAEAVHQAFIMPAEERTARMRSLRAVIREQDIFWWTDLFLRAATAETVEGFPLLPDYTPRARVE